MILSLGDGVQSIIFGDLRLKNPALRGGVSNLPGLSNVPSQVEQNPGDSGDRGCSLDKGASWYERRLRSSALGRLDSSASSDWILC